MSIPESDLEVLDALQRNGLRVVIIGGHATRLHGVDREPEDLDLLVDSHPHRGGDLARALAEVGADVTRYSADRFGGCKVKVPVKYQGRNVDVLTGVEGLSFDEIYDDAVAVTEQNREIRFMSRPHLLHSKSVTGRPRDLEDIRDLTKTGP